MPSERKARFAGAISSGTAAAAVVTGMLLAASSAGAQTIVVMLWPNGAPGSENWTQKEAEYVMGDSGAKGVRNVVEPSITAYLSPAGTASGSFLRR
jgi:hypothetical protein